jgi:uncharacterized protein YihD (DUF1040 family)
MRDPKRIKPLLKLIEQIWKDNPDLRLCQLIGNVAPYDNYHVEDDDLRNRLKSAYLGEEEIADKEKII